MIRQRSLVRKIRGWQPSDGDLFAWTATTLLFGLIGVANASWTLAWWEDRWHLVQVLVALAFVTGVLWFRRYVGRPRSTK